jgi:peptidoglycan lytic transglycosylase
LPRSTLRRALRAGALCLTAATTAAPAAAHAVPKPGVSAKHLEVRAGSATRVAGRAAPGARIALQVRGPRGRWQTLDRDRSGGRGRFVLRRRLAAPMSALARVRALGGPARRLGRLNVYRWAHASWYGPGLYGNHLGCGGILRPGRLGVAHKSLPCGTEVTLRHHGRTVRVPVIDRGPYVAGREFDLTQATARRLGFAGHGPLLVAR